MLMVRGRRRDEWDRLSSLMSLITNRTNFCEDAKASNPVDFMPQNLLDDDDATPAQSRKPEPITIHDLIAMSGVK
jgi:hypothetical protein